MKKINIIFILVLVAFGCSPKIGISNKSAKQYRVKTDSIVKYDEAINKMILPYKQKLDSSMNEFLINAAVDLEKKLPTGSLGSVFCDVLMDYTKTLNLKDKPDICIMNHGGIRIPVIYKGELTVRTIYELMPFENELVIVELSGAKCRELFNVIAVNGGAPVSGVAFKIFRKQAHKVLINGITFNEKKTYKILTSDYLANGGDNADAMLNPINRIDLSVKLRDALITQLKAMHKKGLTLKAPKDERITN